jgi:two-component system chemotaxis response regulator CheY
MANIIVADDALFIRKVIKDMVEKVGHSVVGEASDGKIAIELYKEKRPDLVIMDITMPNTDGLEALKEIIEFDPQANVIICSALGQADIVCKAVKMGAKEYIVKPINELKLLFAIQEVLAIYK